MMMVNTQSIQRKPVAFAAQPQLEKPLAQLTQAPDVFTLSTKFRAASDEAGSTPGGQLKALLDNSSWQGKKSAMAYFLHKAAGLPEHTQGFFQSGQLADTEKSKLTQLAEQTKTLTADAKVQMVKELLGENSKFALYVEKALIQNQKPSFKETLELFKPQQQNEGQGLGSILGGFTSLGLGLTVMPIMMPSAVVFNPSLLGQFIAQVGLWLL